MFSLIFIISCAIIASCCYLWKKEKFKGLLRKVCIISVISAFLAFSIALASAIVLILNADVPAKYASEQEKLASIQSEIEELKYIYGKVSYEEFRAEYEKLYKQLEETQEYIANNAYYMEHERGTAKFYLYFGG